MMKSFKQVGICGMIAVGFYVISLLSGYQKVPQIFSVSDTFQVKSIFQGMGTAARESVCKELMKVSDWNAGRLYFHENLEKMQELLNTDLFEYDSCGLLYRSILGDYFTESLRLKNILFSG